jgi:hypothetical protein
LLELDSAFFCAYRTYTECQAAELIGFFKFQCGPEDITFTERTLGSGGECVAEEVTLAQAPNQKMALRIPTSVYFELIALVQVSWPGILAGGGGRIPIPGCSWMGH